MKSSLRMLRRSFFVSFWLVLFLPGWTSYLNAQQVNETLGEVSVDSAMQLEVDPVKKKIHSPHKATFYSAILPGMGQAYNKKYWKIPILYAGIGAVGYAIHFNSTSYKKYKNAYRDFLIGDPGNKSYIKVIPPTLSVEEVEGQYREWFQGALNNKKKYFKRYRDLSYIGMVAIYILNLVDATVDAHFYNFDVGDDLSMQIRPVMVEPGPASFNQVGLQLSLRF